MIKYQDSRARKIDIFIKILKKYQDLDIESELDKFCSLMWREERDENFESTI